MGCGQYIDFERMLTQKVCKNCGSPLTERESEYEMTMDGLKPLCYPCVHKLY